MTATLPDRNPAEHRPQHRHRIGSASFETALAAGDARCRGGAVPAGQLLARSDRVHLEHRHRRGSGRRPRHARRPTWSGCSPAVSPSPTTWANPPRPAASPRAGSRFETAVGRCVGHLRLKDGHGLDPADHHVRAQGPRGTQPGAAAQGCRARREPGSADLARAAAAGGRGTRHHDPALHGDHRRRAGRHRARRPAAPARRADHHHRPQSAARRRLAEPLQVALPARSGVVRPPAVHRLPEELAGFRAEGQDRRLARDVRQGDGAELLGQHRMQERDLPRGHR